MKNFLRALRMSLKYRYSLAISIFSSLMVALLWGANIGAVYPFVEVVLNGKSMHEWVGEKLQETADQQILLREENDYLQTLIDDESGGPEDESIVPVPVEADSTASAIEKESLADLAALSLTAKQEKMNLNQTRLQALDQKHSSLTKMEPIAKRYLPDSPFKTLVWIIVLIMTGTVIKCLFLLVNMYSVARVSQRTTIDLQNEFFRKTLKMDLASFGDRGTGDLVGRIRGETKIIGSSIRTLYGRTMREPFKMAVCFAGAAWLNWRLLLFSMLICPLAGYVMIRLTHSIKRANRRGLEESAKLMDRLFQALTYIKIVKANNMEAQERSRFAGTANEVYAKGMKIAPYNSFFRLNNELVGVFVISASVLAGGYLVLNHTQHLFGIRMASHEMGFADLLLFYALVVGISDPLRKMSDVYSSFQSGIVACDRIFPLLDQQPTIRPPKNRVVMPKSPAVLEFDSVSFHYSPEKQVLDDVSFTLQPCQSLAIVGANGSGKSTLINLLPRFFDPIAGSIKIGGTDIRKHSPRDLRKYISLVTQQTMLFNDSIANNIRYGVPSATDEQVREAAIQAHAHEFIMKKLDRGYNTIVGEHGGRLSGGQRQRISLARAILRNSPLLILDEATSQIDPESEQLIHQTLRTLIKDRSVIMVTHRMSTLSLADRIMVLEAGRVADFGTHQQLIERCETYRRIRNVEFRESA